MLVGTNGVIGASLGNSYSVSEYEITGSGSTTVSVNSEPSLQSPQLLQDFRVKTAVVMFPVGVPERTPVTGSKVTPAGSAGSETKDATYCGVAIVGVTVTIASPRVIV